MRKVSTLALSVAMALGVAACSPQQSTETAATEQPEAEQQQQLTSGLDLKDFNTSVARPQPTCAPRIE